MVLYSEQEVGSTHSKDALLLGQLSATQRPEVHVGFTAGDDVGAVAGVKLHREHSFSGALRYGHTGSTATQEVLIHRKYYM